METTQDNFPNATQSQNAHLHFNYRDFYSILKNKAAPSNRFETQTLMRAAFNMLEKAELEIANNHKRIQELEALLTIDELTGMTNRRGFNERFHSEVSRTDRGENDGGLLIMIDLNGFKEINDTFGHQAGDLALQKVASFLKDFIRDTDMAARLGGDEFILLLTNTNTEKALNRLAYLEVQINALSITWNGQDIPIRASIGLEEYTKGSNAQAIIHSADKNMYKNKGLSKLA